MILTMLKPFFYLFGLMAMVFAIRLAFTDVKYKQSKYGEVSGNGFFKTAFDKGNYGEFLTFWYLEKLPGENKILTNIYLPKEDGSTTEIDLIMLSSKGIYVFESKNYSGWIFGDDKSKNWTQTLKGGKKNKFYNPVWQNKAHISALKKVLNEVDSNYFYSYIVFSERCELKKVSVSAQNVGVVKREHLLSSIKKDIGEKPEVLSLDQIRILYELLKTHTLADDSLKEQHINNIKTKAHL